MTREEFEEYQEQAIRTAKDLTPESLENWLMGLAGEVGELINLRKKEKFHGHDVTLGQYIDECGDILWYVAVALKTLNKKPLDHIFSGNNFLENQDRVLQVLYTDAAQAFFGFHETDFTHHYLWNVYEALDCFLMFLKPGRVTMKHVADYNLEKLRKRYPVGFSIEASINRTHESVVPRNRDSRMAEVYE